MIEMAIGSAEPLRRAQILAEAQPQLAWALRSAIEECHAAGQSWADIGQAIGLPRETVFRQYEAQGPIVTTKAVQSKTSPNLTAKNSQAAEAIYAIQTDDGVWHGQPDALPEGSYATGVLHFRPAEVRNSFAGQFLRVRVGPCHSDVSFQAAQVLLADRSERRVRVTYEVMDQLFGDGETPLRRALTAAVYATLHNPGVDPALRDLIDKAARAQSASVGPGATVTPAEFIESVKAVVRAIPDASLLDVNAVVALRRLEEAAGEYMQWEQSAAT